MKYLLLNLLSVIFLSFPFACKKKKNEVVCRLFSWLLNRGLLLQTKEAPAALKTRNRLPMTSGQLQCLLKPMEEVFLQAVGNVRVKVFQQHFSVHITCGSSNCSCSKSDNELCCEFVVRWASFMPEAGHKVRHTSTYSCRVFILSLDDIHCY